MTLAVKISFVSDQRPDVSLGESEAACVCLHACFKVRAVNNHLAKINDLFSKCDSASNCGS